MSAAGTPWRKLHHDGCEWNPDEQRAAYGDDAHFLATTATWIVGANGKWRLCAGCAARPEFKRYRKRIPVTAPSSQLDRSGNARRTLTTAAQSPTLDVAPKTPGADGSMLWESRGIANTRGPTCSGFSAPTATRPPKRAEQEMSHEDHAG